jgi:hypothetical protein
VHIFQNENSINISETNSIKEKIKANAIELYDNITKGISIRVGRIINNIIKTYLLGDDGPHITLPSK